MRKLTWDDARADVVAGQYLTDDIRASAMDGIQVLAEVLGQEFLPHAAEARHPLVLNYIGRSPPNAIRLGLLGRAVQVGRECTGFGKLVRGLRDPDTFDERVAVLRTAASFCRLGCDVSLDCPIDRTEKKQPDITVVTTTEDGSTGTFFVEQSTLYPGDAVDGAFSLNARVGAALRGTSHHIRLHEFVDEEEADALVAELEEIAERARQSKMLQEITTSVLEGAIDATGNNAALAAWAKERGLPPSGCSTGPSGAIYGPPPGVEQSYRLRRKIGKEQKQLAGRPGLVLIDEQVPLALFHGGPQDELIKEIARYPNLLGLVHRGGMLIPDSTSSVVRDDGQVLVVRRTWGALVEFRHAVLNLDRGNPDYLAIIRRWLRSPEW